MPAEPEPLGLTQTEEGVISEAVLLQSPLLVLLLAEGDEGEAHRALVHELSLAVEALDEHEVQLDADTLRDDAEHPRAGPAHLVELFSSGRVNVTTSSVSAMFRVSNTPAITF